MPTSDQFDAILPQTQCGLCGFNGCKPYAEALANKDAAINLCPPGGISGLIAIADLMQTDPTPYLVEMEQKTKPSQVAVIREADCIGCTKCIQACPVDAIFGTNKQMHTVLSDECTGCELCIAPCPVDCIDMKIIDPKPIITEKRHQYKKRYEARTKRLQLEKQKRESQRLTKERQAYIQAAIFRVKEKKGL